MRIIEPSTMTTDYLLGGVALVLAFLLNARSVPSQRISVRFWAGALLCTGLAALVGGTYHGFYEDRPGFLPIFLWKATMAAVGLAASCFLAGVAFSSLQGRARRALLVTSSGVLAIYLVWINGNSDFKYAMYFYLPAMLAVLAVQIQARLRRRDAAAGWIIAGILLSFAGAAVQVSDLDLHPRFNHNDAYHILQAVALYWFFRGGRLMRDRSPAG